MSHLLFVLSSFLVFQSDLARFDIQRFDLELSPTEQILILSSDQQNLTFHGNYEGDTTGMTLEASLVGPAMTQPMAITGAISPLQFVLDKSLFYDGQNTPIEGEYRLINVRLEKAGQIVAYAEPRSVSFKVIDDLLVTSVKVRELDKAELERLGYVFNDNDYRTIEFSLTLVVGATVEEVKVPVAYPTSFKMAFKPIVMKDPFDPPIKVIADVPFYDDELENGGGSGPEDGEH